ncbi:MAG: NUDIX domain-containing protein [Gemmatimonadota bacterium]|nr:NUDIX domain-containing protein [Gemmatimonadota bacterium]
MADWCASWAAGTQADRPARSGKKTVPSATFVLAIFEHERRFLLQRRPDGGLLARLWAFPERVLEGTDGRANGRGDHPVGMALEAEAVAIADELGLDVVGSMEELLPVRHRFTHLDATYLPLLVTVAEPNAAMVAEPPAVHGTARDRYGTLRWIAPSDDDEVALPAAQRKVLEAARTRRKRPA